MPQRVRVAAAAVCNRRASSKGRWRWHLHLVKCEGKRDGGGEGKQVGVKRRFMGRQLAMVPASVMEGRARAERGCDRVACGVHMGPFAHMRVREHMYMHAYVILYICTY